MRTRPDPLVRWSSSTQPSIKLTRADASYVDDGLTWEWMIRAAGGSLRLRFHLQILTGRARRFMPAISPSITGRRWWDICFTPTAHVHDETGSGPHAATERKSRAPPHRGLARTQHDNEVRARVGAHLFGEEEIRPMVIGRSASLSMAAKTRSGTPRGSGPQVALVSICRRPRETPGGSRGPTVPHSAPPLGSPSDADQTIGDSSFDSEAVRERLDEEKNRMT
ncbi:hypothetical protein BHE74_00026276 [Ensete ventricosum]|nr:hypothetical protein BHE74_00026276 [Ensete ventricosum]